MAKKLVSAVADTVNNVMDKTSSPRTRAGSTVERVGKMVDAGVSKQVIALQLTENSRRGKIYTVEKVDAMADLWEESKSAVLVTAKQARVLIEDQLEQNSLTGLDGFQPA